MNITQTQPKPFVIDPAIALPLVEKMIYDQAWKCAKAYPVTFEEARSEAYFAFLGACQDFKAERGTKFSSWCYFWIWCHLKTWITKRTVEPLSFCEINEEMVGAAPPLRSESLEMVEDLSEDAKEIISLIIEMPSDLLNGIPVPASRLVAKIKKYLIQRGRNRLALDQAEKEIRIRFQEGWAAN